AHPFRHSARIGGPVFVLSHFFPAGGRSRIMFLNRSERMHAIGQPRIARGSQRYRRGFISVGAFMQGLIGGIIVRVVTFVLGLFRSAKRKQALRARNLSRDSRAEDAPKASRAWEPVGFRAVFC